VIPQVAVGIEREGEDVVPDDPDGQVSDLDREPDLLADTPPLEAGGKDVRRARRISRRIRVVDRLARARDRAVRLGLRARTSNSGISTDHGSSLDAAAPTGAAVAATNATIIHHHACCPRRRLRRTPRSLSPRRAFGHFSGPWQEK